MQGGSTLAEASWSTKFPVLIPQSQGFVPAEVSGENLFVRLLNLSVFTPEDLADLSHSNIPEVRIGVAANLADDTLLAQLASNDDDSRVRKVAVDRLTDVRKAAIERLNDQGLLARLATKDASLLFSAATGKSAAPLLRSSPIRLR